MDAIEVPGPLRGLVIEREPPFFGERVKKLNQEKRIAGRLLMLVEGRLTAEMHDDGMLRFRTT